MLLREQVVAVLPKLRRDETVKAFSENVKLLMGDGTDRGTAYALAFAAVNGSAVPTLKAFLKSEELEDAAIYRTYLQPLKEKDMAVDPLSEMAALDGAKRVLSEQRPAVDSVVKQIEDDLQKAVLVSLARMMREMGYERWPTDPEGREDIKRVIDALTAEMVKMGRRFSTLTKDQMRVLKNRGPKNYERIVRKWLMGDPDHGHHEPGVQNAPSHDEPDHGMAAAAEGDKETKDEAHVLARDPKTHQPTAIKCRCGGRVELEPGSDTECPKCGQPYNSFGQALKRDDEPDAMDPDSDTLDPENEAKDTKNNPFAICTASVGRDDKDKYEKCVKDVKARYNIK